jgi:hypothetical protein
LHRNVMDFRIVIWCQYRNIALQAGRTNERAASGQPSRRGRRRHGRRQKDGEAQKGDRKARNIAVY